MAKKQSVPQQYMKTDQMQIQGNKIFSPLRQKWIPLTPEEMVRQQYLQVLADEYGFAHAQITEEMEVTGRGSAQARADFVIWRTPEPFLPGYVACLIQTLFFLELVQFNRVGTVKQRMYTENLMQVRIPHVPVSEQQKYADAREKALAELAYAKCRLNQARQEVEAMILGVKKVVVL